MSRRHPLIGMRSAVLVGAAGLAALAGHAGLQATRPATIRPVPVGKKLPSFPVKSTSVTGLFPGVRKPLVVSVHNPFGFAIKVTKLAAAVRSTTSAAGCTGGAANLSVKLASRLPMKIKARATAKLTANATMPSTAADACQGATFTVTETARAVRA